MTIHSPNLNESASRELILLSKEGNIIPWSHKGRYKYRYLAIKTGKTVVPLNIPYGITQVKRIGKLLDKGIQTKDLIRVSSKSEVQKVRPSKSPIRWEAKVFTSEGIRNNGKGVIVFIDHRLGKKIIPKRLLEHARTNRPEKMAPQLSIFYSDYAIEQINKWLSKAKSNSIIYYQTEQGRIIGYDERAISSPISLKNYICHGMGVTFRPWKQWEMFSHEALLNKISYGLNRRIRCESETICQSINGLMLDNLPKSKNGYIFVVKNAYLLDSDNRKISLKWNGVPTWQTSDPPYKFRSYLIKALTEAVRQTGHTYTAPTLLKKYGVDSGNLIPAKQFIEMDISIKVRK